jgi:putative glycerol-1-phosphate prenyltransferase
LKRKLVPHLVIFNREINETAVGRISKTEPLDRTNFELVLATAQAGEMLGNKLIYLEGGSGAKQVHLEMIDLISKTSKYH